MKIRITKGDGWYEDRIGEVFNVDEEVSESDVGHVYYVDPESDAYAGGRRFVIAEDCEVIEESKYAILNPSVKVGDLVRIINCEECPDTSGKIGRVIEAPSKDDNDFDIDIPSDVYGDYTFIDSRCDRWELVTEGEEIGEVEENPTVTSDAVQHPTHYTAGEIEVIDIIKQTTAGYNDPFVAHCVGTATKYLNRAPYKHETPTEDLRKAVAYLNFAISHLEEGPQ